MPLSQNGWSANNAKLVASQLVPGTQVKLSVRKDAAGLLLLAVASAFDRLVEDIDNARGALDDWGYAERPIRGGSTLSNHASGTAIDLNAPKHALGAKGTFTKAQVVVIRRILAVCGGAVRWGGDYKGRPDEMHFEINDGKTVSDCQRALEAMRKFNGSSDEVATAPSGWVSEATMVPTLRKGDGVKGTGERGRMHWWVASLQALLNIRGLGGTVPVDGEFDALTDALVRRLQERNKLTADGVVGPLTWPHVLGNDAPEWA